MFIIYNGKSYQNVMKTGGTPSFQNGKLQIWKHVAKIFSATSLLQGAEDCAHRLLQPLSRDWINVLELYAFVPGRVAICCNTQSLFHATNLVSPFQPTLQPTSVAILRFFVNRVSGVVIFCAFRNNPTITWADQTSHVPGFPGACSSQSIEYWM